MLVKKTIVLYGKGGQGHLTAVRVGGSTGLKLVLEAPIGKMALAFKAGNSGQLNFAITAAKTEIPLEINLESQDELSAVVYSEDGSEMLSGGKKAKFIFPKEIFDPTPQESKYTAKESDNAERTAAVADNTEENATDNAAENATDNATDNATENTGENAWESNAEKVAETFADNVQAEQADTSSAAEIEAEQAGADITRAAADEVSATEEREAELDDSATAMVGEEKINEEAATETVEKEAQKVDKDKDKDKDDTIDLRAAFSGFAFNKGENFYINIRGKLEEIMTINPECKELERLIPDSKWVKVYYDEDEYYVVGILTEEGAVKYLGYGVPGVEGIRPPKEAEELCDFLASDGEEEGYWIMLQKADNGELVK